MLMQTRIGKRGRTNKYDSIKGLTADFILQGGCYKLEMVFGSKRVRLMCTDKGYTFEFV